MSTCAEGSPSLRKIIAIFRSGDPRRPDRALMVFFNIPNKLDGRNKAGWRSLELFVLSNVTSAKTNFLLIG
jgi:hypothetical protein